MVEISELLKLSYGSGFAFLNTMLRVFSRLFETYVCWPSVEERKDISREIKNNFDFPYYVGLIDGTLFPLFAK